MGIRVLRRTFAPVMLAALLASCQMEVGVGAKLRRDGSGTLTLAVAADKEFIDGLSRPPRQGGLGVAGGFRAFEDLFDALEKSGWTVKRTKTPAGDVALTGGCAFARPRDLDRCLRQLSASGGRDGVRFRDTGLTIDVGSKKSFFKTHSYVAGSINLAGPQLGSDPKIARQLAQLQQFASSVFHFDVRAELPGTPRVVAGGSQSNVKDGVVTWRPEIGQRLDFRAESDAYDPLALVLVSLPLVLLLGLGAWALMRRRPRTPGDGGGFVAPVSTQQEVTA